MEEKKKKKKGKPKHGTAINFIPSILLLPAPERAGEKKRTPAFLHHLLERKPARGKGAEGKGERGGGRVGSGPFKIITTAQ